MLFQSSLQCQQDLDVMHIPLPLHISIRLPLNQYTLVFLQSYLLPVFCAIRRLRVDMFVASVPLIRSLGSPPPFVAGTCVIDLP